jgi:hypothetical protein
MIPQYNLQKTANAKQPPRFISLPPPSFHASVVVDEIGVPNFLRVGAGPLMSDWCLGVPRDA